MRLGRNPRRQLALAVLAAAPIWSAQAINSSWTFAGSGNWSVASNWNGGVPGSGSGVFVTNADTVNRTITYDYTGPAINLASITFDNTGAGSTVFNQAANTLSVGAFGITSEILGNTGSAYWNLSGGTHNVHGLLSFGQSSTGRGTGTLSGTGSLVLDGGVMNVGESGIGTFVQSGGSITSNNGVFVGDLGGSSGTYSMSGGSMSGNFLFVGNGGTGVFNQAGGFASFPFFAGPILGVTPSAVGTYTLSGTGSLACSQFWIGGSPFNAPGSPGGNGAANINGGTASIGTLKLFDHGSVAFNFTAGQLTVGTFDTSGNPSRFNWTGGSLTVNGAAGLMVAPGVGIGGAVTVSSGQGLIVPNTLAVSAAGSITLGSGGSISTGNFDLGSTPSRLNWSGGQLLLTSTGTTTLDSTTPMGPTLTVPFGGTLSVAGTLVNNNSLTVNGGAITGIGASGSVINEGFLTLNGGTISVPTLLLNDFAGVMTARGAISAQFITNDGELDLSGVLSAGTLSNLGQINIGAANTLNGNVINSGVITLGGGALGEAFATGTISNNSGGLIRGGGGIRLGFSQFGGTLEASDPDRALFVVNIVSNSSGSTIRIDDGCTLDIFNSFTNAGLIRIGGVHSLLAGSGIINTGTIRGIGEITGPVFNSGIIRAEGAGHLDFSDPASTNTSTGQIQASSGNAVAFAAGLATNAGTIALSDGAFDNNTHAMTNSGAIQGNGTIYAASITNIGSILLGAGATQLFAPLTNGPAAHVSLTGAGSATFYGDVVNQTGSMFNVDANSTAIFLGNVTGLSAIVGSGTKYYAGSAGGGAVLSASGTTIVSSSGNLAADTIREGTLEVDGTAAVNANGTAAATSRVGSLKIAGTTGAWSGRLDLANNAMVVDYAGASPIATIADQLRSGYAGGAWNGAGISSSSAATDATRRTALGFAEATDLYSSFPATFRGQSVDNTSVLIRYTLYGDANLDGVVDTLDFNSLAANFGKTGRRWSQADFNYDGVVDTLDFNNLAANFGRSVPADSAVTAALVPEPGAIVLLVLVPTLLTGRRRRFACV